MWIQPTYQQTLRIKTLRCLHHRYIIISEPMTGSRWWQLETLTLLTSDLPWLNQIFSEIIIYRYMFASFNVELQVFSMMMHSYLHHDSLNSYDILMPSSWSIKNKKHVTEVQVQVTCIHTHTYSVRPHIYTHTFKIVITVQDQQMAAQIYLSLNVKDTINAKLKNNIYDKYNLIFK